MKGRSRRSSLTKLSTLLMLLGTSTTYAGGFQLFEYSASSLGNAFAGSAAAAEDASYGFFNPAGNTFLDKPQITGVASIIDVDTDAHIKESTANSIIGNIFRIPAAPVLGSDHQQVGTTNFVPALHVALPQCHRLAFGLSIASPYGLVTKYSGKSKARYLATWSKVTTIDVDPNVSLQVTPQLSIGAGIDIQYVKADLNQKVPVGQNVPPIAGGPFPDGEITNRASNKDGIGWNAGALYQLNCGHTRLGASYRSRVHHTLEGEADLTLPAIPGLLSTNGFVTAGVTLPDYANLSFYHDLNCQWALLGSVNWTHWSLIDQVVLNYSGPITDNIESADLVLAFKDTWRYALGANYQVNCRWKLRAGVAYDESPVKNTHTRTYRLPDNDRIWASLGVQYKISECFLLDAGYAHLFVDDATADQTRISTQASGSQLFARTVADFDSNVNIVSAQLTWRIM